MGLGSQTEVWLSRFIQNGVTVLLKMSVHCVWFSYRFLKSSLNYEHTSVWYGSVSVNLYRAWTTFQIIPECWDVLRLLADTCSVPLHITGIGTKRAGLWELQADDTRKRRSYWGSKGMFVTETEGRGGKKTQKAPNAKRSGPSEGGSILLWRYHFAIPICPDCSSLPSSWLSCVRLQFTNRNCFFMGKSLLATSKEWESIDLMQSKRLRLGVERSSSHCTSVCVHLSLPVQSVETPSCAQLHLAAGQQG